MQLTKSSASYDIPDVKAGIYTAALTGEVEQFESPFPNQETGIRQQVARMVYAIQGGDHDGEELQRFVNLTNKNDNPVYGSPRAIITQDVAAILGVDTEDVPDDLDVDELTGKPVTITVKLKPNKEGVKVPRVVGVDAAE
jgi:hypothetical protein